MAIYKKFVNIGMPMANNIFIFLSRNSLLNYQKCASSKYRSLEKKLGLPPKPKRPLIPFIQYTQNQRSKFLEQYPNTKPTDLIKLMAVDWQNVNENEKENMRMIYDKQMENYTKQIMIYQKNLTDDQKNMLQTERMKRVSQVEKNTVKSKLKELGRPKRPPTAFVLYMISRLNSRAKDINFPVWLSSVAKDYAVLPEEAKQKFREESVKLREQYKTDLELWESKMIKLGKIDVIRKHILLELQGKDGVFTLENDSSTSK